MSQVDLEIIKLAYEAASQHGVEAWNRFADPGIEVVDSGTDGAPQIGSTAVAELLGRYARQFDEFQIEVVDLIEAGDRVVACLRVGGVTRASGVETWTRTFHVHTVRDGLSARIETYPDRASALLGAAALRRPGQSAGAPEAGPAN